VASLMQTEASSLDGQTVQQTSARLGAENQTTQQTIGFAVPMLFGALNRNASNRAGVESLKNAQIG